MGWVFVYDLVVPEIIDIKWIENLPKFWGEKKQKKKTIINPKAIYVLGYYYT
jgi:hypothetical protein